MPKAKVELELSYSEMLSWWNDDFIKVHIEKALDYKTENVEITAKVSSVEIQKEK